VSLSLAKAIQVDDDSSPLPWQFLPGTFPTAMAPGSTTQDQQRLIIGGTRNNPPTNNGSSSSISTVAIFDTTSNTWSPGPVLFINNSIIANSTTTVTTDDPDNNDNSTDTTSSSPTLPPTLQLLSPGMTLDTTMGMVLQFGGLNTSMNLTNNISILNSIPNANGVIANSWSYSGPLDSVPGLYAPIVLYLPSSQVTLIMGGCDQVNGQGQPIRCAAFDTLYTLSSDVVSQVTSLSPSSSTTHPKAVVIKVQNSTFPTTVNASSDSPPSSTFSMPSARWMPCAVVLPDGNIFMMGGEDPTRNGSGLLGGMTQGALSDAWILNTQNWTWFQRSIGGNFPSGGIKGHSCQVANNDQILVIGGNYKKTVEEVSLALHYSRPCILKSNTSLSPPPFFFFSLLSFTRARCRRK
jgi:hypothetical protein